MRTVIRSGSTAVAIFSRNFNPRSRPVLPSAAGIDSTRR